MEENEQFNLTIDLSSLPSNISVSNQVTVTIVDDDGTYVNNLKNIASIFLCVILDLAGIPSLKITTASVIIC